MATPSRSPIVDDPRTYEIIGAAMEVGIILNFGCKKLDHRRVEPYPTDDDDD